MIRIFFDFDGTLIDVSEKYYRAYFDFMQKNRIPAISKKKFWKTMRYGNGARNLFKNKLLADKYKKIFVNKIEREEYLKFDKTFLFTITTLKQIKVLPIKLFLVTLRRNRSNFLKEMKKMKLNFFDDILIGKPKSGSNKNHKIKKQLIENIAKRDDIMIGDSEADILAAKTLGLKTVGVLSGIRNRSSMKKIAPDFIIRDIRSLKHLKIFK